MAYKRCTFVPYRYVHANGTADCNDRAHYGAYSRTDCRTNA